MVQRYKVATLKVPVPLQPSDSLQSISVPAHRKVQVPHYNYVGDSVLGEFAHTGAGVILSNFKSDGSNVKIRRNEDIIETGLRKFGAILGNHADIGCNSVLFPGTLIGQNTNVYPLTRVRGEIPANKIVKDTNLIVDKEEK